MGIVLNIEDLSPAQHLLEVITVFDWIKENYPNRKIIVIGSSYGGFLAAYLTKYRQFDGLILRAPAIYRSNDFYTKMGKEDREATQLFRKDAKALAKHSLFNGVEANQTKTTLLIIHENDEQIPKETTQAYTIAFKPDVILMKGISHSLDNVTAEQVAAYNQKIFDWLALNS